MEEKLPLFWDRRRRPELKTLDPPPRSKFFFGKEEGYFHLFLVLEAGLIAIPSPFSFSNKYGEYGIRGEGREI